MGEKIINYFRADGLLHILCCLLLVRVMATFLPLWLAVAAAVLVAVAKEFVWDKLMGKGTCENRDLLADAIGILLGLI